MHHQVNFHFFC